MQLRNGTNTISDGRFEAAKSALREEQWYDQERASAGRTEELPYQMSTRHTREWTDLREDRKQLSVQEWIKRYPDTPNIKQRNYAPDDHQREHEADLRRKETEYQKAIIVPIKDVKFLSDDVLITIWERREKLDPAFVRAAAHELSRSFPGFHATPALWHKLASTESYEAAASSVASLGERHNAARTSFWSSEISAGKALREQQPKHQEQAQKVRQQQA